MVSNVAQSQGRLLAVICVVSHPRKHLHPFLAKREDRLPTAMPHEKLVIALSTTSATSRLR